MKALVVLGFCLVVSANEALAQDGAQQFAALSDFSLQSGNVIRDCQVGYRTFGRLNADKSNAVLVPTWFSGTTADLQAFFGPGKLIDSSRYFVVAVDSLGNGVSTSPSNSRSQPRMAFPKITIRDMVNSQHQLLTHVLGIDHLKAVVGISMGGMQVFEWMVAYPGFAQKAVPIVGSPRLAPYDLLLWQAENDAIRTDPAWKNGEYVDQPAKRARVEFAQLLFMTPQHYNAATKREEVAATIAKAEQAPAFDANNHIRQSESMMAHDVSAAFGGSMEHAAAAVTSQVLVIVSATDHVVSPGPAREFGRMLGVQVVELGGDCGHLAFTCEASTVQNVVATFLAK